MIEISITGNPGSGKTTLAIALRDFLAAQGFTNVQVCDYDITNGAEYSHLQEQRMVALRDREVIIMTASPGRNECNR